ncbi:MAG: glutathione S-transferase C-terminal domain-containing protein, partial [Pseudomonadota bacterium]
MGMLIAGKWDKDADRSMVAGTYQREQSALPSLIDPQALREDPGRFVLVASASCPWSHGAVITLVLSQLWGRIPLQWAGGPRIEGYGLLPDGPIIAAGEIRHAHQLYTLTDPDYTGRATVPILWDSAAERICSNASADIIAALNQAGPGPGPDLHPAPLATAIETLTAEIFEGLSNAVYRAGKAQRQDAYDQAVDTVFATMDRLEARLTGQHYLFGEALTTADIRLFATLVRFDTVYATHFRCTRRRLVDYPALWRFTRRIYQLPGIKETIDFDEIRFGYYVNDGSHNPFGLIGQQPDIDWEDRRDLG